MKSRPFLTKVTRLKNQLGCCDLCGQPCQKLALLCQYCEKDLPIFSHKLTQGNLLNWPAIEKLLHPCHFDQLICLSSYQWPFSTWVSQYKYQQRFELAELFGSLLSNHWQAFTDKYPHQSPELILAVPMHIKKWQARGFNQAQLIAKVFAKNQQLPFNATLLFKDKATASQVGKSGVQRRKNMHGTISLTDSSVVLPEHVLLIDDVVTTGATANEVCQLLKKHGVKKITLMTLCIALIENS